MKRNIFIVAAAALAMMATSCTKENEETPSEVKQMPLTITANYGGGNGKVAYTESGSSITAKWQSGDKIYVVYDGYVSELSLTSGDGTDNGTFEGRISYRTTPTANSILGCYVKDQNNASAVIIDGDNVVYSDAAFQSQDATLAGAAKCNTYFGMATYGDGTNVRCHFSVNTSMCKFTLKDIVVDAQNDATLEYTSGSTTVAVASWSERAGDNLVYLAIPAGSYSGEQKVIYTCGATVKEFVLSSSQATFLAGHTYSKALCNVSSITLNHSSLTLKEGRTETLSASVLPAYAEDLTYTWTSDATGVATVDQNGVVTAVSVGTAHIRATANDGGGAYGECTVTVLTPSADGHALSSAQVGEIICSDGLAYAAADIEELPSGVTVVAKVIYTGSNTGVNDRTHGLAMSITDDGSWEHPFHDAVRVCNGMNSTTPIANATWMLPSLDQWEQMFNAAGGCASLCNGFTSVGGTNMEAYYYWTSTTYDYEFDPETIYSGAKMIFTYIGEDNWWSIEINDVDDEEATAYARACLAF